MHTYVINTSENKTFDSDQLFKLVGYNKISWMNYRLDELDKCAELICEKQTVLGADDFRIAILIDFYGFDRVRAVYGVNGYSPSEEGVDLSIYFPYLEAYMVDHLFAKIQRKEIVVREKHVFYIQDGENDGFNVLDNKEKQLKLILKPEERSVTGITTVKVSRSEFENEKKERKETEELQRMTTEEERQAFLSEYDDRMKAIADLSKAQLKKRQEEKDKKRQEELDEEENKEADALKEIYVDVPEKRYSNFKLHCTKSLSLDIAISDYPYTDKKGLSFHEFYLAFKQRESQLNGIKRHHYYASFGSGAAKAAFDALSLSLYLIKLYEREEQIKESNEFVIERMEPEKLKNLLVTAWNKICSARTIAINNGSEYYDLKSLVEDKEEAAEQLAAEKQFSKLESITKAQQDLKKLTPEETFNEICAIASERPDSFSERDKKQLDELMKQYLEKRDDTKESASQYEFRAVREECKTTTQCPSRYDYDNVVEKKKETIAEILTNTINIEYISKDYTEQKKKSEKAYSDYIYAKNSLGKSLFGDVGLWLFMLVVMLVPFILIRQFNFESVSIYILTAALFTGLYALAFIIRIIPLVKALNDAKARLRSCYLDCRVKQAHAMYNYKRRYEIELIKIENLRYELRNITRLYDVNLAKNKNIEEHRQMLALVEDKLSAMLNNLGVEPTVVRFHDLSDEFDVNRPITSNDNKIYKIFSIDAIEDLFGAKER